MAKVFKNVTIATGTEIITDGYIRFDDRVRAVGPMSDFHNEAGDEVTYAHGKVIVPGFIDVHCHGGYGYDTMDADPEKIDKMVRATAYHEGVTSFFCTTITQSNENIARAMVGVKQAAKKNKVIQGIHLEGPFIDAEVKGAQPEKYITQPDAALLDQWNDLAGGLVKIISFAPENDGARELEDYCIDHGIVPSVGHSMATRQDLLTSKVSHTCHLYNAQSPLSHREPGVAGHTLLQDEMYAELIMDGYHICPDMLQLAYSVKGPEKIELITDSMRKKGLGDGVSELGGQKVFVEGIHATLADGTIAGSVLPFITAFQNAMKFTTAGLYEAVLMSSVNQAREFGLTSKGGLQVGKDADLNVLDADYNLLATYSYGELVTAE